MIKLEVDKTSLKAINENFAKLDALFRTRALAKFADMVYERTDDLADIHTQSGEMIRSLYIQKLGNDGYEIGFDDNKAPHAKFVHFGTRAHDITPRNRRFLRWSTNDRFIFAKHARHPGYKGDPFLYNALNDSTKPFLAWLDSEIAKNGN